MQVSLIQVRLSEEHRALFDAEKKRRKIKEDTVAIRQALAMWMNDDSIMDVLKRGRPRKNEG